MFCELNPSEGCAGCQDGDPSESFCIGGGDPWSEIEELASTDARRWKSLTSCCSSDIEFEDLADFGKSSNEVRRELVDVLFKPNKLDLVRNLVGPGSLSTVAKEMTDARPTLAISDEDIE